MQLHWHTEPFLLLSLLACSWIYTLLTGPFRKNWLRREDTHRILRACAFHSGILLIYVAVGSPIDQLAEDYLFFVHMIQHMMLVYMIPPLLFLGVSSDLSDYLLRKLSLKPYLSFFCHPVVAGLFFSIVYTVWHIPLLYEAALYSKPIHILEHATMFLTAAFMWWPFLSPKESVIKKPSYGIRILYAFLLMVAQLPVFAFLSFSNVPIYETYIWAPRIIPGLDPLNDQILGGIIMKVTNMGVSLLLISVCFYRWYRSENPESEV